MFFIINLFTFLGLEIMRGTWFHDQSWQPVDCEHADRWVLNNNSLVLSLSLFSFPLSFTTKHGRLWTCKVQTGWYTTTTESRFLSPTLSLFSSSSLSLSPTTNHASPSTGNMAKDWLTTTTKVLTGAYKGGLAGGWRLVLDPVWDRPNPDPTLHK